VVLKEAVKGLDCLLRRCLDIREFSRDPDCILRLGVVRAGRDLALSDGTRIARGEPVGDLHLWNERVPPMPPEGPTLSWAVTFQKRMKRSLELLAAHVEGQAMHVEGQAAHTEGHGGDDRAGEKPGPGARYRDLKAFRAVGSFMSRRESDSGSGPGAVVALARRLGFEVVEPDRPAGWWRRFAEFWENLFNLALVWAYNPPSLRSRGLRGLGRVQLWISRDALIERYGVKGTQPEETVRT